MRHQTGTDRGSCGLKEEREGAQQRKKGREEQRKGATKEKKKRRKEERKKGRKEGRKKGRKEERKKGRKRPLSWRLDTDAPKRTQTTSKGQAEMLLTELRVENEESQPQHKGSKSQWSGG